MLRPSHKSYLYRQMDENRPYKGQLKNSIDGIRKSFFQMPDISLERPQNITNIIDEIQ